MNRSDAHNPLAPDSWVAAEMMGIDGPFTFSERVLQRIWMRGDFDRAGLQTSDGRAVQVVHPGRWNLLAGPDFREAKLVVGGVEVQGDVELHITADEWRQHGHAGDPAYDGVVLHVVLFPPGETFTRGAGGRMLPVASLLHLLRQDLEACATEEALDTLAGRSVTELRMSLENESGVAVLESVLLQAGRRWRQKAHFARRRIERLGWEAACHHAALEILGYRMNRPPMLSVAAQFPLSYWKSDTRVPAEAAEEVWESQRGGWRHRGVRPANYPRQRLQQYARWVEVAPNWPERLRAAVPELVEAGHAAARAMGGSAMSVAEARRRCGLKQMRSVLAHVLGAEALGQGSTRLDTFFCDGIFPLVAAISDGVGGGDLEWLWHVWLPGDQPEEFASCLKELGLASRASPVCHGMCQGLLGWLLQHNPTFRTGEK